MKLQLRELSNSLANLKEEQRCQIVERYRREKISPLGEMGGQVEEREARTVEESSKSFVRESGQ